MYRALLALRDADMGAAGQGPGEQLEAAETEAWRLLAQERVSTNGGTLLKTLPRYAPRPTPVTQVHPQPPGGRVPQEERLQLNNAGGSGAWGHMLGPGSLVPAQWVGHGWLICTRKRE